MLMINIITLAICFYVLFIAFQTRHDADELKEQMTALQTKMTAWCEREVALNKEWRDRNDNAIVTLETKLTEMIGAKQDKPAPIPFRKKSPNEPGYGQQ